MDWEASKRLYEAGGDRRHQALSLISCWNVCCWLELELELAADVCVLPGLLLFVQVSIDYRPVHMQPLDSEMEQVPPKARVY